MSPAPGDWTARAHRAGEFLPPGRLDPACRRELAAAGGGEGAPWAVACSGGADSVALLLLLFAHYPASRRRLSVLHFNHRLRGAAADGDEAFVEALAADLGLAFAAGRWEREGGADPGRASEADARSARHAFFAREIARAGPGGALLLLGHQMDDIIETQLMRLARGSGTAGLAAPRPVQRHRDGRVLLRPLLTLRKAELRAVLRAAGAPWREDDTNRSGRFFRNRIRRDVAPALGDAAGGRDIFSAAALSRQLLEEDDDAVEAWLDELLPATGGDPGGPLDLAPLRGRPTALFRRALRRWLVAVGAPGLALSRPSFENLLGAVLEGRPERLSAGPEAFVIHRDGKLQVEAERGAPTAWKPLFLPAGAEVFFPGRRRLRAGLVELSEQRLESLLSGCAEPGKEAFLDPAALPRTAVRVRPWRAGDRYQPLGAPGRRKLKDCFIDRKIPLRERNLLPVVCRPDDDARVLWCPGLPPAEDARLGAGAVSALRLTYAGPGVTLLT